MYITYINILIDTYIQVCVNVCVSISYIYIHTYLYHLSADLREKNYFFKVVFLNIA